MFDADVEKLFAAMQAAQLPTLDQLSPPEARAAYVQQAARLGGPTTGMAEVRDLAAPTPVGPVPLRLYRPDGAADHDAPALIFFHGGGWVIGDLDSHDKVCRDIADRAQCLVIAVDYRLAPEHPAPAAAKDSLAAFHWIVANAATLGADPNRLAVGGDSAGGNLSAVAALDARDHGIALRAQILIYPSVDLRRVAPDAYPSRHANRAVPPLNEALLGYFRSHYLQDPSLADDWRLSPMAASDKAGVAPALVIVAERDMLYDDGLAYAAALRDAGVKVEVVDVPGMIHGFITLGGAVSAAGRVIDKIADTLRGSFATTRPAA